MSIENYDEEFGPNRVNICPDCGTGLSDGEICWCISNRDKDVQHHTNHK